MIATLSSPQRTLSATEEATRARTKKWRSALGAAVLLSTNFWLAGCGSDTVTQEGFYEPSTLKWAEQGWTSDERERWHHMNMGQQFAPLNWLKSLHVSGTEQNFLDFTYLRELGFLPKPASAQNPEALPVGFSLTVPRMGEPVQVGLSCAACHTGQINYRGQALRIDGGAAGFDLIRYFTDYSMALGETYNNPVKWSAFYKRMQSLEPTSEEKLKKQVEATLGATFWDLEARNKAPGEAVDAGHGRMDPFNRIGNQLLGFNLLEPANYHAWNAPVSVPYMWDVPKLDWVHYNASFSQPMARNILQVLGNGGTTSFVDATGQPLPDPQKWQNDIDVEGLVEMEYGYSKLRTPKWPAELLGEYNADLARQGRHLFTAHCASCHAPRPISGRSATSPAGMAQLAVTTVPLQVIGTDPAVALTFKNRRYIANKLIETSAGPIDGPTGLTLITNELAKSTYDKLGYSSEQRATADGNRSNRIRALAAYKARPLDGVWSTAPFLHNGSVPNVYELLSPPSERSITFWVGTYEYDPIKLGYVTSRQPKGFELDTRLPGNSNAGHVFSNDKTTPGVIGPALNHTDRMALIEYLKAMPDMPPDPLPAVPAE